MPRQLTITPAPFKSSYLSIPPTPFSPRLPITPPASPPRPFQSTIPFKPTTDFLPSPPAEPLPWLWQCHRCKRVYQLGVTRRCLDDGHFFCAGSTTMKRSKKHNYKKVVRHQACASEFDYQGWKAWGVWKGDVKERIRAAEVLCGGVEEGFWFRGGWAERRGEKVERGGKDCWNECHYPSECTWSKRYGAQIPTPNATPTAVVVPSTKTTVTTTTSSTALEPVEEEKSPKTSFEDILLSIADPTSEDYLEPLSVSSTTHSSSATDPLEPDTSAPSMDDLLQSAKRRKRRSSGQIPLVPSPLGANPVPEEERDSHVVRKSVSSGALLESLELEIEREARLGGVKGEWKEKADALVRSSRAARDKLQTGTM